jgi:hypothetical protein
MYEIYGGTPSMSLKVFEIASTFNQRNEHIELTTTPTYKFTIPETQTHVYFYDTPNACEIDDNDQLVSILPTQLLTDPRLDNQTRYIVAFLHSRLSYLR